MYMTVLLCYVIYLDVIIVLIYKRVDTGCTLILTFAGATLENFVDIACRDTSQNCGMVALPAGEVHWFVDTKPDGQHAGMRLFLIMVLSSSSNSFPEKF